MNNLFSVFDPQSLLGLSINWVSAMIIVLVPSSYWLTANKNLLLMKSIISYLYKETLNHLSPMPSPGLAQFILSLFMFILLNNFLGLFPYVFTASTHLTFTLTLSMTFWLGYFIMTTVMNINNFLSHLVPMGTPYVLLPFMVLIELVSAVIRPLTLCVRLAANMVAGHLLLCLISSPMVNVNLIMGGLIMMGLLLLSVLEVAVSFIQSYVFSTLSSLYISEVNYINMN
uniref:ATP synthase subunit a n=1 Tax=Sinergasilus polycolpus TaxID=232557 RepID=A0A0U2L2T5_SINPO|nr:ATP synthase F0 subunit 6 [Sinergasilus polycolpus]ALG63355.1 ATP synthase F0 subunit 6 [Sinergasilus polycolpus]